MSQRLVPPFQRRRFAAHMHASFLTPLRHLKILTRACCLGACANREGPCIFTCPGLLDCRGLQGPASEAPISRDAAYSTVPPISVACPSPQNDLRPRTGASLSQTMQSSVTRPTPPLNLVRPPTIHHNHRWILPSTTPQARRSMMQRWLESRDVVAV